MKIENDEEHGLAMAWIEITAGLNPTAPDPFFELIAAAVEAYEEVRWPIIDSPASCPHCGEMVQAVIDEAGDGVCCPNCKAVLP